ncbi:MAG: carbohydrate ABC transporter permease [Acinetobacter sp.]
MKNKIHRPLFNRIGLATIYLLFLMLAISVLAALMTVITKSISSEHAILTGTTGVLPDLAAVQWDTYKHVFTNASFMHGLYLTITVTLIGTFAAMISTVSAAYALSKTWLRGRKFLMFLFIFVMVFSGGLIPTYLTMGRLGLLNTYNILWMAGAFTVSNMLIMKTSFEAVPIELEEAALIDGASQIRILINVYLPVSKSMLAVIALYYAVDYWNNYYTSMIYTTKTTLKSLQLVLKDIIYSSSDIFLELRGGQSIGEVTSQSTVAACIVVATLPILITYPFLQRYFAKGVMIGSVKG